MAGAGSEGGWDRPEAGRIAIPVAADRLPDVTTRAAVDIGRQAGLGLEFVDAAPATRRDERVRTLGRRCDDAVIGGASPVSWEVVDGGARDVGPYITWSGATLRCIGTDGHRRASSAAVVGGCAVPLIVVGHRWRPPPDGYRHVVVGLDGDSWHNSHIAASAAILARRLGAEVQLVGVVAPRAGFDDVLSSAHLHWISESLDPQPQLFETVSARDPGAVLARFLDVSTLLVVGAPCHHRWILGGVAGELVRRAASPIVVVPVNSPRGCCRVAGAPSGRSSAVRDDGRTRGQRP